ncbi:MAG: hypothetical protein ACI9CV_001967, partial [Ilumatobacter sp.]
LGGRLCNPGRDVSWNASTHERTVAPVVLAA